MGREPNEVELAVFSLMWSEHCGYKHSRRLLKTLPTEGPRLVLGPGENAGAVSVGRGAGVRVQGRVAQPPERGRALRGRRDRRRRHPARHLRDRRAADRDPGFAALRRGRRRPRARATCSSARSPGSATTATRSGSRPSAARSTSRARTSRTAWSTRCASGLIETDKLIRSAAAGVGNIVVLFGAKTGPRRDRRRVGAGVAPSSTTPRTSGRPCRSATRSTEKKLLECSLELLDRGLLVALQDLGAAGLTSSSAEMAAKGEVGLDLDVRLRAAARGRHGAVRDHDQRVAGADALRRRARARCRRCSRSARAGRSTAPRSARSRTRAACACSTARRWSATCRSPRWSTSARPTTSSPPSPRRRCIRRRRAVLSRRATRARSCSACSASANLASRALGVRAVRLDRRLAHRPPPRGRPTPPCCCCPSRSAIRVTGALPARTATARGPRSPSRSTATAAASPPTRTAARSRPSSSARANLACVGAEPLGLTNCLNFGNPEKPHIAWQLTRAVAGLGDACRAFGIPVVGGNVSLYNEGAEGPIYPTPVVGLVGELPDAARAGRLGFARARRRDRAGHRRLGRRRSPPRSSPSCAARPSRARCPAPSSASSRRCTPRSARPCAPARCSSAHDVAEGGVAVALAECALASRPRRDGLAACDEASCSARARARSSSPARPRRCARSAPPRA